MQIVIKDTPFDRSLYGFRGTIIDDDYPECGLPLMDKVCLILDKEQLNAKGLMHWVYEGQNQLFVGTEIHESVPKSSELILNKIHFESYAYWLHKGSYNLLAGVHDHMHQQIKDSGFLSKRPSVEEFEGWSSDESKLLTHIRIAIY